MKIVVDAFGGDYAPYEIVAGAVKALQENVNLELVLVGDKDKITEILQKLVFVSDRLEIVHAPDVVTMDDIPTVAIRTKKTSSIVVAYDYLKQNDDAVALVSAGSTGATLTGAVLKLGRVKGVVVQPLLQFCQLLTMGKLCFWTAVQTLNVRRKICLILLLWATNI